MKFVCSFAWTDLKVTQSERDLVMRIVGRLGLDAGETQQVERWLQVPPADVDPTTVPPDHRKLFLDLAELVVRVDGEVAPEEAESLELFRDLLRS